MRVFVLSFVGTTLTFDPPIARAPATLDRCAVADFAATGPFRVTTIRCSATKSSS